jgi:hypothetical protein
VSVKQSPTKQSEIASSCIDQSIKKEIFMKKVLLIGLIVALALIVIGGAGVVYARASGVMNNPLVFTRTFQNGQGDVRVFTYGSGELQVEDGDLPCLDSDASECGRTFGPGGMMQGYGYGPGGMMGGRGNGYGPRGMMGGRGLDVARGEGPMHEYMISAFAAAVDLTAQEVETRLEAGETFKEIAFAQGITQDQLPDLVTQVRKSALDAAVADGTVTQAQADLMLEHMDNYMGPGFGPGFKSGFDGCPMMDGDD